MLNRFVQGEAISESLNRSEKQRINFDLSQQWDHLPFQKSSKNFKNSWTNDPENLINDRNLNILSEPTTREDSVNIRIN